MKRSTTAAILLLLLGVSLFAGDSPVTYNAITDLTPRPEPPLPTLGPAGSKIVDPTFHTTILRVTDGNTNPEAIGGGFLTPGGSFEVNWNADSTMFWVWTVGGMLMPFRFDAANFAATPVRDLRDPSRILTLPYTGMFSFRRPNIMYATTGRTVIEYDFNTQTSTKIFDANAAVPSASGAAYAPFISDDDTKVCLAFGGYQDTHPYVAVLDRNTGVYNVLDTMNSRLNGQPTNKTLGFGIHSAYLDRSGRYVIIAKGQGKVSGQSEWTVWDVQAGRVYDIDAEWSGHDASAFGVRVNQSGFYGGDPAFYEEQEWAIRGLSEGEINNYKYLLAWQNLPTPHQSIYTGHHSWNNARPDALVPVVGSIARDATQTSLPWRAWDNEIIGVATDGSGKVYRFAHHRSVWDRSDFWDDPHGNISQDGRWYIFTSNWGRTLGSGRRDVFIVALPAGSGTVTPPPVQPPADTTAPQVAITFPLNGGLVTGPVKITASASDAAGVAGVQFLINGQPAGAEDTASPYEFGWTPANGSYTIAARARDAAGNVATSAGVTVTVQLPPASSLFQPFPPLDKSAPSTYEATTDTTVRQETPAPALGPAGSVITDAAFGSRILRVTDGGTLPAYANSGFGTPAAGHEVNWNADTTMFWIHAKPGAIVFRFDAANLKATLVADRNNPGAPLVLPGYGPFSFRRPNILYAGIGRTVAEYDVSTQSMTTVFDGNAAVPQAGEGACSPSLNDDESRIALAFGGQQGTYPYVAVLDRAAGRYHVLDTRNSLLNGQPTAKALGFGIYSAYIDRTGRYVIVAKGQDHTGSDWLVWDVDAGSVYDIAAEWSGRDAAGFGVRVNQSGFYGGDPAFYEEQQWAIRGLGEQQINNYTYLLDWQQLPTPHQSIYSGQHSWNNARSDISVPVIGSVVRDSTQSSLPWRIWDDEIIGVATDGSRKVYRFAHHHSRWDRSNQNDMPRGNVSQDGRFYAFTSNWDGSLGADPDGGMRRDVFIVALTDETVVPGPSPVQPPPPPQNPAAGNLLANPGFEEGTANWAFFDHPRRSIVTDVVHSGSNAAKVGISSSFYSTVEQIVPVTAGTTYKAATWMTLDLIGGARGAGILLFWLDASGREIGETAVSPMLGTLPWTYIEQSVTAPAGAVRVKFEVWCFTDPDDSGTAVFDDAYFGIPQAPMVRLTRIEGGERR